VTAPSTRCLNCKAPIRFQPGAGSRLCHFCDTVNLVREQTISVPQKELQIDEVFLSLQQGLVQDALGLADKILASGQGTVRLKFYRAQAMFVAGRAQEAVYHLVDLTGEDAPLLLRADIHAQLAEILWAVGRQEEALAAAEKALGLVPGHPVAALVKVRWLLVQNRLEAAGRLAEETLRELQKPPRITFPPPPLKFWLLLARIHFSAGRMKKTVEWLENMLLSQAYAPLAAVAEALTLLGRAMFGLEGGRSSARELLRSAVILDGHEREAGKFLKEVLEREGENWPGELELIEKQREQLWQGMLSVLSQQVKLSADQQDRSSPIEILGHNADSRVDMLQKVAGLLGFEQYDRGTLYPLKTLDDFCRWLEAARARRLVSRLRYERQEKDRLERLRQLHKKSSSTQPRSAQVPVRRRSGLKIWFWTSIALLLTLGSVSFAAWGDRWLCEFHGRLRAVECDRQGRECWLVVDGGEEARNHHQKSQLLPPWKRWYVLWRDQKLSQEGIWYFPLNLLWWRTKPDVFRPCIGGEVGKQSFNLLPRCLKNIGENPP